ncbi:P-loop containing nucleoside triphosphate hydrolase protein [Neoconidiobolus thromboides FSU 785]|nr:P-loop containing nucleoside triphosphate hydrolase protein [Neoconidiobolus thromboides FSU 785]
MIRFLENDNRIESYNEQINKKQKIIKICMLGTSGVGKTNLLNNLTKGEHVKLSSDEEIFYRVQYTVNKYSSNSKVVHIWDISGKKEYETFLHLGVNDSKIVLGVFNICQPESLLILRNNLLSIIYKKLKNCQLILIGTHSDLNMNLDHRITIAQGWNMARSLGALGYFQISNKKLEDIDNLSNFLFDFITLNKFKKECKIM